MRVLHRAVLNSVTALAALLLLAPAAQAQLDFGSITGFVKDPSGSVVPKAKVTVINEATSQEKVTAANDSGYFVVTNLIPGTYTVSAELAGFKKSLSEHNVLFA